MEGTLGCPSKQTATEQKDTFTNMIHDAVGADDEKSNNLVMEIQDTLNTMIDDHNTINGDDAEPVILTNNAISDLLVESGVPEEISMKIEKSYTEEFGETPPAAENLIDNKILAANEQRKKEKRLEKQVEILENKLKRTLENNEVKSDSDADINNNDVTQEYSDVAEEYTAVDDDTHLSDDNSNLQSDSQDDLNNSTELENQDQNYDIVLQVKPEKVNQIKSQIIDGKKYLVIPVDDDDQANVNGIDTLI